MELIATEQPGIKEGYKQTEVGVIPVDWEVKDLVDVAGLISGQHILSQDYNYVGIGIPYLTGPADFGTLYPIVSKWTKKPKAVAIKNDILVTVKGDGVGKLNFLPLDKLSISRQLMAIRANKIDCHFLYRYLDSKYQFLQDASSGSTVPGLSRDDINKIKICFPSPAEQKAIATALSDVDAIISNLDKLIAKKKGIKQGAMQQLLKSPKEGGKRLPGFEGDWEVKLVEEIAMVKSGKRLPLGSYLVDYVTPYPYIRVADMFQGGVSLKEIKYVPEGVHLAIKNYRIFKGDIFISVAGTLGIIGVIPDSLDGANLTENANRFTDIKCDRDYLLYILMSSLIQDKIESERTLGAQPKLALTRIRKFQIPIPPTIEEQKAIATVLREMDAKIESLKKKKAKYQAIKQGMMQELLTGKTRLV